MFNHNSPTNIINVKVSEDGYFYPFKQNRIDFNETWYVDSWRFKITHILLFTLCYIINVTVVILVEVAITCNG